MKNLFSTPSLLILLIFIIGLSFIATAQTNLITEELKQAMANRTQNEKKLESNLFYDVFKYNKAIKEGKSSNEALKNFDKSFYIKDEQNRILIQIQLNTKELSDAEIITQKIEKLNGKLKGILSNSTLLTEVYCWIPAEAIVNLVNTENIKCILIARRGRTESITTVGYTQLKAQDVINQYGVTGVGYRIGVISDGVKSVQNYSVPADELPCIDVRNVGEPDGDEGTAPLFYSTTSIYK